MSVVDKIYVRNSAGVDVAYDISADATNVYYDKTNNITVKNKIISIEDNITNHISKEALSENGSHGIRYLNSLLQVLDEDHDELVTIETGGGIDILLGDVAGATVTKDGGNAVLTWSDPADVIVDGVIFAQLAGTVVVRKVGSAPQSVTDGTIVVTNTIRNQFSVNGYSDNNLELGNTYYWRFFPYKLKGSKKVYTTGSAVSETFSRTVIPNVPSVSGIIIYDGQEHTPTWINYNQSELEMSGDTTGTAAATYNTIFTPRHGYEWSDGTVTAKTVSWRIAEESIPVPSVTNTSFVYNGTSQGPTISSYDSTKVSVTGATATDVGEYQLTIALVNNNTVWSDGTIENKVWNLSISRKQIMHPTLATPYSLTYDGTSHAPTLNAPIETLNAINITGTTSAINAGRYTITASLKDSNNCCLDDNTTEDKDYILFVTKADGFINLDTSSILLTDENPSVTVHVTSASGPIDYVSFNINYATVEYGDDLVTYTKASGAPSGVVPSEYSVIDTAATDNYNYVSTNIRIVIDSLPLYTLTSGTDTQIESMLTNYYAGNLNLQDITGALAIGDTRQANGTDKIKMQVAANTTTRYYDATLENSHNLPAMTTIKLVILDFNHDVLKTAINNITKSLITIQMYGLINDAADAHFGDQQMSMNDTDINTNGLEACVLRTYTNGNFYNALGFKTLVKQVVKQNCKDPNSAIITTTDDYCFLPSEYEVYGEVFLVPGNEGIQYNYFEISSNRIKYTGYEGPITDLGSTLLLRSPCGSSHFSTVNSSGECGATKAINGAGVSICCAI